MNQFKHDEELKVGDKVERIMTGSTSREYVVITKIKRKYCTSLCDNCQCSGDVITDKHGTNLCKKRIDLKWRKVK